MGSNNSFNQEIIKGIIWIYWLDGTKAGVVRSFATNKLPLKLHSTLEGIETQLRGATRC
jgi:hypothetical protein